LNRSKLCFKRSAIRIEDLKRPVAERDFEGKPLWISDFKREVGLYTPYLQYLRAYVTRTTLPGEPCGMLYLTASATLLKWLSRVPAGKERLGFAGYIGTNYTQSRYCSNISFAIVKELHKTNERWVSEVRITTPFGDAQNLQYRDETGTFVTIETDPYKLRLANLTHPLRGWVWSYFKLVADFNKNEYVRFKINQSDFDLTGKKLQQMTTVYDWMQYHFEISGTFTVYPRILLVKDLVITCDEP